MVYLKHAPVLRAKGSDLVDLVQRISTNDVSVLSKGKDVSTIFTTEKGRIFEFVHIVPLEAHDTYLLILAGCYEDNFKEWLSKYIIMEDVEIEQAPVSPGHWLVHKADFQSNPIPEAVRETLLANRFIAVSEEYRGKIWVRIVDIEGTNRADHLLEVLANVDFESFESFDIARINAGIPFAGKELSESYNPLESMSREYVSFTKGCYVGQEVIARLDSYRKVSKILVRVEGDGVGILGNLLVDGKDAGSITSIMQNDPHSWVGLAYIRGFALNSDHIQTVGSDGIIRILDAITPEDIYGVAHG